MINREIVTYGFIRVLRYELAIMVLVAGSILLEKPLLLFLALVLFLFYAKLLVIKDFHKT